MLLMSALESLGRTARVDPDHIKRQIANAGFTDIQEEVIACHHVPWTQNEEQKDNARWFNLCITEGLMALSLQPFLQVHHWKVEDIESLCAKVKGELCTLNYRGYCLM